MFVVDVYDRLPGWAKFLIVVALYAASSAVFVCCFFPLEIFSDDGFVIVTILMVILVALGQWGISSAARRLFGWAVFTPAFAIAGSTFVPAIFSILFLGFDVIGDDNPLPALPVVVLLGIIQCLVLLAALRRVPDSRTAVTATVRGVLGVLMAALVAKLWPLPLYVGDGIYLQSILAPLATLFAGGAYFWRRNDVGAIWIWPAGLLTATTVLAALTDEGGAFAWQVVIAAPMAFAPGVLWWLIGLIMAAKRERAQLADIVSRFAAREFTGEAVQPLDTRWQFLVVDIIYAGIAALLLYRAVFRDVAFSYSLIVEIVSGAGYAVAFVLLTASLILRGVVRKRVRPVATIAVSLISIPIIALVGFGALQLLPMITHRLDSIFEILIALAITAGAIVIVIPLATLWLLRNISFGSGFVASAALFLIGALVCDAIFVTVLGASGTRFDIGLPVGDVGSLVTIVTVGIAYLLHRKQPWAFLIWPAGAVASGILMRGLITFQGTLNDITSDPTIKTDFGGVIVASVFGALAAAGVLLAKRVWIDKDPDARMRAVRVRGALLIVHGIAPILILVFLGLSLNTFVGQARVDYAATTQSVTLLAESAFRIKDQVTLTVDKIRAQADLAVADVKDAVENGTALAEQLVRDGKAAADEAIAAAGRVASAAAGDVAAEAAEVVGQIGDELKDAFTIPPLDLGVLGTIEFPDLGIGDKISELMGSLFSGLIPSFDLNGMFNSLVSSSLARIDAEFAGPKASAQKMLATVRDFATANAGKLQGRLDGSIAAFRTMTEKIDIERKIAVEQFSATLANLVVFLYHLLVFIVMAVIAGLLWLLWKVINGLVIMAERVSRGWKMMAYGDDVPPPALRPRRAAGLPVGPDPTVA